jgi:hypothetical protein
VFLGIHLGYNNLSNKETFWRDLSSDVEYRFESEWGVVSLRKRSAYPVTFCRQQGSALVCGYGVVPEGIERSKGDEAYFFEQEFLLCTIDLEAQSIAVYRDAFCTLPLFVSLDDDRVSISNDMQFVTSHTQNTAVNTVALDSLVLHPHIDHQTLLEGITLLGERTVLKWGPNEHKITKRSKNVPVIENGNPKEFKQNLETTLERYWELAGENAAIEASGGLDSSALPLFLANRGRDASITLASMEFIEGFKDTQSEKLHDLLAVTRGTLVSTSLSLSHNYPLARFFEDGFNPRPFYQYQEIYTEALNDLAGKLSEQGYRTVFTGIGGDELFENIVEAGPKPILSPEWWKPEVTIGSAPHEEPTLLAHSAYYAGQSRNNVYIDHDIWPVAPLSDPALYRYTQSLGIEFRSNKNILRAYQEALRAPTSIYYPRQNEHFGRFFDDAVKANYESVLVELGRNSYLEAMGYLEWEKVTESFFAARWRESRSNELFQLFRLATAEVVLQSLRSEA